MPNVIQFPPREWKLTPAQKRAVRAYCAAIERLRPMQIVICPGWRVNLEDAGRPVCLNLRRVTDREDWADTDLHDVGSWTDLDLGVRLDPKGRALVDLYIYRRGPSGDRGELLGNAQVFAGQHEGQTRITGFAATAKPFQPACI